jgi:hypothetical protein
MTVEEKKCMRGNNGSERELFQESVDIPSHPPPPPPPADRYPEYKESGGLTIDILSWHTSQHIYLRLRAAWG